MYDDYDISNPYLRFQGEPVQNPCAGCFSQFIGFALALLICGLVSLLTSCGSTKTVVVELRDSTSTQVVTKIIEVIDTQYVTLPAQSAERTTLDTTSTLRIMGAESTATFSGGLLHHTLRTLPDSIPVAVTQKTTRQDSIVYREKEVPVPCPVVQEVNKLTYWQNVRLCFANLGLVALAVAALVWLLRKRYFTFYHK